MNIFRLKYPTREIAIADLLAKGILLENLDFCAPIQSVVSVGFSVVQDAIFDEQGNELTPAIFDGILFDLMVDDIIETAATFDEQGSELTPVVYKVWDFGANEVFPENPIHTFAGY